MPTVAEMSEPVLHANADTQPLQPAELRQPSPSVTPPPLDFAAMAAPQQQINGTQLLGKISTGTFRQFVPV
jgi:hypothetical protein